MTIIEPPQPPQKQIFSSGIHGRMSRRGSPKPMPQRNGMPSTRSMPLSCSRRIRSMVSGLSRRTPSTPPSRATTDMIRATDRALPCLRLEHPKAFEDSGKAGTKKHPGPASNGTCRSRARHPPMTLPWPATGPSGATRRNPAGQVHPAPAVQAGRCVPAMRGSPAVRRAATAVSRAVGTGPGVPGGRTTAGADAAGNRPGPRLARGAAAVAGTAGRARSREGHRGPGGRRGAGRRLPARPDRHLPAHRPGRPKSASERCATVTSGNTTPASRQAARTQRSGSGSRICRAANITVAVFRSVTALQLSVALGSRLVITSRHLLSSVRGQVARCWRRVL